MEHSDCPASLETGEAVAPDAARFMELYEGCRAQVFAVLLSLLRDRHDAEELVSVVVMQALRKFGQLRDEGAFSAWICKIAKNMAINALTRRNALRRSREDRTLNDVCSPGYGPDKQLELAELGEILQRVIVLLRPLDGEIIDLRYRRGLSYKEMARELGTPATESGPAIEVPMGTVKRRLHSAHRRLKAVLVEMGKRNEIDVDALLS